jgi:hypothetical protein
MATIHCPYCQAELHPPRCCCRYRHEEWVLCANCSQQFRVAFGGDRAPSVAMGGDDWLEARQRGQACRDRSFNP